GGAAGSRASSSKPAIVRREPSSAADHGTSTHSLSQEIGTFMGVPSERRKLFEEAQIVLEEQAHVIDAIAQHRQPVDAGAEGIAAVALRIDTARLEHVR